MAMRSDADKAASKAATLKDLCLRLMRADAQKDVVDALDEAGYWTDATAWRLFGDNENNYSTIGNQQSRSDAALVEKIVNSIDARLVNACLTRGTDPESSAAPQTIREAVARFFENRAGELGPDAGRVKNWPNQDRSREARLITVSATGFRPPNDGYPCITIADAGEGQAPSRFPDTFLSLNRSNKLRIPFVQGKFNMGGTGALQFSGKHNLQLVVSRRNPSLLATTAPAKDRHWGFTIVRREDPEAGQDEGRRRSSTYTYLAPGGDVLWFEADSMPIFPEGQDAYKRPYPWGTLIKLYEYETKGFRSNIVSAGQALLRRIDLLLPEVALPVRLYECRPYKGHEGSFETNVTGVGVRLEDDRHDNLEEGFPASAVISAMGEPMKVSIFAFKRSKAEEYRMHQGVIFAMNGQTHGHLSVDFFRRKAVGMSYLADSLFVMVDCSGIAGRAREDLFMNSRDRLRENALRNDIEDQLESIIKSNQGLRDLANRRRQEDIAAKLDDSKPLVETLEKLIKQSPALASLFNMGTRISNPFAPASVGETNKQFEARLFPTYFRFKERAYGATLTREAFLNRRPRIVFETDAENSYLSRDVDPGQVEVHLEREGAWSSITSFSLNVHNGVGNLNCPLPHDAQIGDELTYRVRVTDSSRLEPFENTFVLRVRPAASQPPPTGGPSEKKKPPSKEKGTEREKPSALAMPPITRVEEKDWARYGFTKTTALKVKHAGASDPDSSSGGTNTYDFYVNVDNQYLRAEQKRSTLAALALRDKFTYAIVLIGLALLQEDRAKPVADDDETNDTGEAGGNVEKRIDQVTSAIAPVLLPMLDILSNIGEDAA